MKHIPVQRRDQCVGTIREAKHSNVGGVILVEQSLWSHNLVETLLYTN